MKVPVTTINIANHTGNISQLFYAQRMRLCGGMEDGLEAIEINNGGGMRLLVLPGRCMDIGRLDYRGTNLSFLSKRGFSHSSYCSAEGNEGINTFAGGFLTTCGLRNVGPANECEGETFGFHGRIGQTPAAEVCVKRELLSETPYIEVSGKVRECRLFGPCLELYRQIRVYYKCSEIVIHDIVTNWGDTDERCMLLYHFNMGYPLLDEQTEFWTGNDFNAPCDENAAGGVDRRYVFKPPAVMEPEQCFNYLQRACDDGLAFAACVNRQMELGVVISSSPEDLPYMCNWQSWRAGDYAMGIEPGNCYTDGRCNNQKRGQLELIPAYGCKETLVRASIIEGGGAIEALRKKARF